MTRPLRSLSTVAGGYTRLERAVSQALASELRDQVPDLADQFASARPTLRRNSAFGLFTELQGDPNRPYAGPTGDLGTVHVMISGLRDPVAFTARVSDGRLLGLMGSSYGQDTRAIDFASVHFDQVFTLDPSGRSVPFQSAAVAPEPVRRPSRPAPTPPPSSPEAAARQNVAQSLKSIFEDPDPREAKRQARVTRTPSEPVSRPLAPDATPALPTDRVSLLIGAWALLAVVAVFAVLLFDIPWPFALIAAFWIGAALRKPKALDTLQRGVEAWNARQSARG